MSQSDHPHGAVPDADPLDELASAIVDGEATVDEQARIADPEVAARVAEFERAARVVGSEVPPATDEQRDATIAAALAAWGTPDPLETSTVDELSERRDRRARGLRWVGVAAAVIAALVIGGAVLSDDDSSEDMATEALDEESDDGAGERAATEEAESSAEEGADAAAGATGLDSHDDAILFSTIDLGTYDDVDALLTTASDVASRQAAATDEADTGAGSASEGGPATTTAEAAPPLLGSCSPPRAGVFTPFTATLDEQSVLVWVVEQPDGRSVFVIDPASCDTLAERTP